MWLDLFPDEVCERLALHVCHRKFSVSALHLAESSEKQRAAVVVALNFCFPIEIAGCDEAERWAAVFSLDVREYKGLTPLLGTPIGLEDKHTAPKEVDGAGMEAVIVSMLARLRCARLQFFASRSFSPLFRNLRRCATW